MLLGVQTCALPRSEEHTSELQSLTNLVCSLLLEKKTQPGHASDQASKVSQVRGWRPGRRVHGMALRSRQIVRESLPPTSTFFFNETAQTQSFTLSQILRFPH